MQKKATLSIGGILLAIVVAFFLPSDKEHANNGADYGSTTNATNPTKVAQAAKPGARVGGLPASTSRVGFTSPRSLAAHFEKHGRDFGAITQGEYLTRAKALRDASVSATLLELTRSDGVITRFDKQSGGFVAFHKDRSIRTFFRPNDGEPYFRRQARR